MEKDWMKDGERGELFHTSLANATSDASNKNTCHEKVS